MSNAARGTFEELLNGTAPELADIARRLRQAIFAVDPAAVETVRLGDNAATYGVGPKKMTEGYAYIMPMRGYVNLGFYQGASLEDARLEGTGKGLRHVKNPLPRRSVQPGPARASGCRVGGAQEGSRPWVSAFTDAPRLLEARTARGPNTGRVALWGLAFFRSSQPWSLVLSAPALAHSVSSQALSSAPRSYPPAS